MAIKYSDIEIDALISELKPLGDDYKAKIHLRDKRGHKEKDLDITGSNGNRFRLILRESLLNPLDFSIILVVLPKDTNQLFRLRRYNGKSHEHTNPIEGDKFYDFHIHTATARYQELGVREDTFAEPAERFSDFHTALDCMIEDCGFEMPINGQQTLF